MSGLRFCHVTTFYPPYSFGGDGIVVQRLARALARRGHHVTVVHDVDAFTSLSHGPVPEPEPDPAGVEVVGLRSGAGTLSPALTQQLGRPVLNAGRIRRLLAEGRFDVVNFHNVSLIGGPGLLRMGDAVKLYTAHEHWLVCPSHVLWRHDREPCTGRQCLRCVLAYRRPPQLWRYTGAIERAARHVDAFIALSEFSRAKHREFGFEPDMEVVPGFLPEAAEPPPAPPAGASGASGAAAPPHDRPYFLFVGRLERIKGLDDVIPLFRRYPGADLVVAGDGEHAGALRGLASGMTNVRFLGRVPGDELAEWYRHAVALIVPSAGFETFGLILLEAFRAGAPVIARRIGPFPEIVAQAGSGELFSTDDELLAAMGRMQADPGWRSEHVRRGRLAAAEQWSEAAVLPRYLDVVRRAAERKGARRLAETLAG